MAHVESLRVLLLQGSLKVGTRTVSISYSHPDDSERSVNVSTVKVEFVVQNSQA